MAVVCHPNATQNVIDQLGNYIHLSFQNWENEIKYVADFVKTGFSNNSTGNSFHTSLKAWLKYMNLIDYFALLFFVICFIICINFNSLVNINCSGKKVSLLISSPYNGFHDRNGVRSKYCDIFFIWFTLFVSYCVSTVICCNALKSLNLSFLSMAAFISFS